MTISIEGKFLASHARPTGFDYLRLSLACAVVCVHSIRVSYGSDGWVWASPMGPIIKLVLPMFFAMGGFLVFSSLQHCRTIGMFIGLRILRIYPALGCEVILSAFILGAIYTTVPLTQYFTSREFFYYIMNVTGFIHYFLPGVFVHNPDARYVNIQLWTVPTELKCIILMYCLMLIGIKKRRILAPITTFTLMFFAALQNYSLTHSLLVGLPNGTTPSTLLLISFLFGGSIFLYKDRIPYSHGLFALSLIVCLVTNNWGTVGLDFNAPFVAYVTTYIGLQSPRKISILRNADYSYGIYLYGYPIQQTFATFGKWTHNWYWDILFCLPMSALAAIFSWHVIEKPALGQRSKLKAVENVYLAWKAKVFIQENVTLYPPPAQ